MISVKSEQLAWLIRRHAVEMTHHSGASHIASILSVADIVAVIYSGVANVDPKFPDDPKRDRVILSKGHAGAAIYAALAETGFFDPAELLTVYQNGSRLSGHVSHKGVPGVDFPQARSVTACPLPQAWQWQPRRIMKITGLLPFSETGNAMKARFGRPRLWQTITGLIILSPLLTIIKCKALIIVKTQLSSARLPINGARSAGMCLI